MYHAIGLKICSFTKTRAVNLKDAILNYMNFIEKKSFVLIFWKKFKFKN